MQTLMAHTLDRPTSPRPKALVIFDEEEAGNVWGNSLNQIGIDVVTAHTREDAVAIWAEVLPDLVPLEDFNVENEELEICRSLRPESPVPILLLTNKSDEAFLVQA
jgi:DNA-binding response OmpR family regulator